MTDVSRINPLSISVTDMAKLLSAAGGRKITEDQIRADVQAGAPIGANERMNLVHYTAWLMRESQQE